MALFKPKKHEYDDFAWPTKKGWFVFVGLPILVIVVLAAFFDSYLTVPSGYTGIVTTFSRVSGEMQPGFHWKIPFAQKVTTMNVQVQNDTVSNEGAATLDLQEVGTNVVLNYHLDQSQVDNVFVNLTPQYQANFIQPLISESLKSVTAKYTAADLIGKRADVAEAVRELLVKGLQPRGILVDNLNITNFQFSSQFTQAVDNKQAAQQAAEQAQYDLQTANLKAQANQVQQAALTDQILEQQAIAKWNGALPGTVAGNSTIFGIPLGK